jgi:hypothetical protein
MKNNKIKTDKLKKKKPYKKPVLTSEIVFETDAYGYCVMASPATGCRRPPFQSTQ